jgi:hypothetical protein
VKYPEVETVWLPLIYQVGVEMSCAHLYGDG